MVLTEAQITVPCSPLLLLSLPLSLSWEEKHNENVLRRKSVAIINMSPSSKAETLKVEKSRSWPFMFCYVRSSISMILASVLVPSCQLLLRGLRDVSWARNCPQSLPCLSFQEFSFPFHPLQEGLALLGAPFPSFSTHHLSLLTCTAPFPQLLHQNLHKNCN